MGTPSSGVKPIVVSTDRPSRTAVTEHPPPDMADDEPLHRDLLARPLHGEAVEAVAADPPVVARATR
jgi:hypothetical protein